MKWHLRHRLNGSMGTWFNRFRLTIPGFEAVTRKPSCFRPISQTVVFEKLQVTSRDTQIWSSALWWGMRGYYTLHTFNEHILAQQWPAHGEKEPGSFLSETAFQNTTIDFDMENIDWLSVEGLLFQYVKADFQGKTIYLGMPRYLISSHLFELSVNISCHIALSFSIMTSPMNFRTRTTHSVTLKCKLTSHHI